MADKEARKIIEKLEQEARQVLEFRELKEKYVKAKAARKKQVKSDLWKGVEEGYKKDAKALRKDWETIVGKDWQ